MATQDDYIRTALRVPPGLHRKLHEAAQKGNRTFNAEIVERLQQTFETLDASPKEPSKDWAERFDLYRLEAKLDTLQTRKALTEMQARMLDSKLDELALRRAGKAETLAPARELEAARALIATLDRRIGEVLQEVRTQERLADEVARAELTKMNEDIDRSLQDDLLAVAALEDRLGVPDGERTVFKTPRAKPKPHAKTRR